MITVNVTSDLETCFALRRTVFMDEQNVSEADEFDGRDHSATHLLATINGVPMGTARLLIDGSTGKIGRVCVLQQARGTGLGARLITASLDHFRGCDGVRLALLEAQTHALGFYEKLGFHAFGPVFDDAGIAHRKMQRAL